MKLGSFKIFICFFVLMFANTSLILAADKIESYPLINLENLSPTFEEDKNELDKVEEKNVNLNVTESISKMTKIKKNDKIYIHITALDKITGKTSAIRLAVGEKNFFGPLEISALKCQLSENNELTDTVAYLQVRDLSNKDNNQVFLFNGWTFASSPTLSSLDHGIYDLWLLSCSNI